MKTTNRIPPQNVEAEQALLGTILLIGFSILFNAFNNRKKYIAAGAESVMLRRTAETCAAARLPVTAAQ